MPPLKWVYVHTEPLPLWVWQSHGSVIPQDMKKACAHEALSLAKVACSITMFKIQIHRIGGPSQYGAYAATYKYPPVALCLCLAETTSRRRLPWRASSKGYEQCAWWGLRRPILK
jgi:hypothetical protein